MAYDRNDPRQSPRDERPRRPDDRHDNRERGHGGGEERGFFERAGEQISSWFGDGDDDEHGEPRGERAYRERAERGAPREQRHERDDYRPMAGDYGRSEGRFAAPGNARGIDSPPRQRSGESSAARSQHHDPHYQEWRQRQIDSLDRDYDEYRREHQSKFENDFGSWRDQRQTKRQMLGQIRAQMEVVGSDDAPVGTVDRIAGERIILAKSDPDAGGARHSLSCSELDRIDGERVILGTTAEQAKRRWRDENRDRALFEREDQGQSGAHMLDRSFSGTYR